MRLGNGEQLTDFCEVCGRFLVSRPVRRAGRCGAHSRQPMLGSPEGPSPVAAPAGAKPHRSEVVPVTTRPADPLSNPERSPR